VPNNLLNTFKFTKWMYILRKLMIILNLALLDTNFHISTLIIIQMSSFFKKKSQAISLIFIIEKHNSTSTILNKWFVHMRHIVFLKEQISSTVLVFVMIFFIRCYFHNVWNIYKLLFL